MRPLRLGLLGTGVAARKLYWPALAPMAKQVQVVACANRTRSKALDFAREAGIPHVAKDADELFAHKGLDAVFLSLPIEVQPAYVLKALKAGLPVLSEKPLAPSLAEGRRLLKRARPYALKGPAWMVAENYRFMPSVAWCEERLAKGELGEVRVIEVRQSGWTDAASPYFHTAWRTRPKFVGGFVLDAGVHLAHVARRLFGSPVELKGLQASFNPDLPPMDTALAVLRFGNGSLGAWLSSFSAGAGGPMLSLRGSLASLELHTDHAILKPRKGRERAFRSGANSFSLQFAHFADVVLRGAKPAYSPQDALEDLAFIEGVVRGRALKA